jgi:hypothetical protein
LAAAAQAQVDEARAGDLQRLHPALHRRLLLQRGHQGLCQLARVLLETARHLHGGRDGQVAVGGLLGGLESSRRGGGPGCSGHLGQCRLQCPEQGLLRFDHAAILLFWAWWAGTAARRSGAGRYAPALPA